MKRICVFCGSSPGRDPRYAAAARELGHALALRGLGLVYGGASVGLMGIVADAALAAGGEAIGVLPAALARKEIAHPGLSELRLVDSMHERKAQMVELSDGFVALPGGVGTLEEFFEVLTWAQLGLHAKPCGLLDVAGYWRDLERFLDHAVRERFVKEKHRRLVLVDDDPRRLLDAFAGYAPELEEKWIDREQI
ncbi:MAG TPA: TIGR00730 family Rossman fold protein [Myxococcota bacterium]|jgi:uncharacterized protein (TIGR00730 family)|nr:TIGR00730 family Rossman fold protein [Myxococcota bacterium]